MPRDPYRHIARLYDRIFESGMRGLAEVTLGLAAPPAGARVLDVGCGTGVFLALCAERGLRGCGVDPSGAMLAVARRRLSDAADLRQGSGTRLPFGDGELDAVFATLVLHELDPITRRATLGEMIRVTANAGVLAIADYHDGPLHGLWGVINRVATTAAELAAGRAHWAGYRHFKAHGCVPGLVADAPVTIIEQKVVAGGNLAVLVLRRR
jgi:ubiquinone/menaquinone biosynthesis C-methylase UbiE